jgi:predicted RNA-binding protein with PUA-like domain
MMVDIEAVQEMEMVSLVDIKANPALDEMPLVQRGQRLSVQPVSKEQYDEICRMGGIA